MDDSEDVQKIDEIIKRHKVEAEDPDELEYAEFIDYADSNEADDTIEIDDYEIPEFPKSDITKFHTYAPVHFLTVEEKRVVESCPDPELKQLLLLNRNKNIQLMQLYKKIRDLLAECQQNIAMKEDFIAAARTSRRVCNRIWRLGIPYFKTKDDFPCPRNEDTIRKHNNGELFFYDMSPSNKWLERDVTRLLKGIAFHYRVSKETELEKEISKLEREIKEGADKEEIVQELKNQLEDIRNSERDLYPPLGSDQNIDWNRIADSFLKERYSGQDCQVFWNTYLHPDINKGPWSEDENLRLKNLAFEYSCHNWDLIAAELGNNRTGFIACVRYFCKIDPPRHGRFTEAEDKLICDLVAKYRHGDYIPWSKIAHHFTDRTRGQLFYRYRYFLSCRSGTVRGKFTEAEDILIMVLVDRFGKKFTKCAEYFPNRSVVQIKARYSSNLKGAIKKGSFTIEEDEEILNHVKENGTSTWEPLVHRLNRCGGQIRQRYKTLMIFFDLHAGYDLSKAPRRRFTGVSSDAEYDFLRCMADKFKNREKIPTLEDIERLLEKNPKPQVNPLDPLSKEKVPPRELRPRKNNNKTAEIQDVTTQTNKKTSISSTEKKGHKETGKILEKRGRDDSTGSGIKSPSPEPEDCSDNDETFSDVNLSVDNLLIDFFSNSLKLNSKQTINQEHIQRAAGTVSSILSTLQAELHIPKNFEEDSSLDPIDLDILKILTVARPMNMHDEYVISRNGLEIEKLIPPNLNTVVGMRSLLIKNQIYKSKLAKRAYIFENFKTDCKEKQVQWCIDNHLSNQSQQTQDILIRERRLFFKRFVSLFKFPAILTLQKPSDLLEDTAKTWRNELSKGVRTYVPKKSRPNSTQENTSTTTTTTPTTVTFETVFIKQQPPDDGYEQHSESIIQPPKLSIVEQLKRRINDTIDELSTSPPPKKYYKFILPAAQMKDVSKKTDAISINTAVEYRMVPKTYVPKHKAVKPKSSTVPHEQNKNKSVKFKKENPVKIKIENLQDSYPDSEEARSSFNVGRGELVLDNDSPGDSASESTCTNQDMMDLAALNAVLKKERNVVEESFDF